MMRCEPTNHHVVHIIVVNPKQFEPCQDILCNSRGELQTPLSVASAIQFSSDFTTTTFAPASSGSDYYLIAPYF